MSKSTKTSPSAFQSYRRLLYYVKKHGNFFLFGILGTILLAATDAGFIWFLKPLLDKGFVDKDLYFIRYLPLILIFAFLKRNGLG